MDNNSFHLTLTLYIFVTIAFITWYIQSLWKRRHIYKLAAKIPGPKGWPIIGNVLDFTGSSNDIYNRIITDFGKYPNLGKVWYGPILIYAVSKPEYLKKVLCSPHALTKMYFYRYAMPAVGNGLFTASVPTWKRHRKLIMPTFNQKILNGFIPIFQKYSNIMVQQLEQIAEKSEFDFFDVITKCTMDIFCETAMGVEVHAQSSDSNFGPWIDRIMEIMFLRMFVIWYHFDFIFKWTRLYKDECDLIQKFHTFTENVIRNKRQNGTTSKKAFLDHLLDQNVLTDEELRDEVNTFMIAGSDTTASTLSFIFLMLGMHKEVQQKVYNEIQSLSGDLQPQDLLNLKYTERVIKETLRLFPVGAFIVRDIQNDIVLDENTTLFGGSSVMLGIMQVHRSPEYWPNPLHFDPDRFLPEAVAKRHPFAFLPFSGGPRNCVGPTYAMMSMKAIIAITLKKFEFFTSYKSIEDIRLKTNLTLKTEDGFKVSIKLRK